MACTSYIITLLKEYCEAKNKTVVVALAGNRIEKKSILIKDEIEFYKNWTDDLYTILMSSDKAQEEFKKIKNI